MSKLTEALKSKFKTPREAMKALGLDLRDLQADIMAGDSKEAIKMAKKPKLSRQAAIAIGVLSASLRPKLASDAKLDLRPLFQGVTAQNYKTKKKSIIDGLKKNLKLKDKKAMDSTIGEVAELLNMIEQHGAPMMGQQPMQQMPGQEGGMNQGMANPAPEPDMSELQANAAAPMTEPIQGEPEPGAEPPGNMEPPDDGGEEGEGEDGDNTAEVEALLKGKVDDATLAQVCNLMRGSPKANDVKGGEEKLKELGAADDLEEDPNCGKGTGTGEGSAGGGEGSANDEENEEAEDESETDMKHTKKAMDNPPPFKGMPEPGGKMVGDKKPKMVSMDAMNAAIKAVTQAQDAKIKDAVNKVLLAQREVRDAERAVRPWVGELAMAHDSAEAVYGAALKMIGVQDVEKIHPSAYRTILEMQPVPGSRQAQAQQRTQSPVMASDEAQSDSFAKRFPNAARIGLQ